MMTREAISKAMQDRILMVVFNKTGISRATLMKLRDNNGPISKSIQVSISNYLGESDEDIKDGG